VGQVGVVLDFLVDVLSGRELAAAPQPLHGRQYLPMPRPEHVTGLRAWVEQIYRPGYGHLAASLGPCWDKHPLCLYSLDWLMELWSALYLVPERNTRTLANRAEWQIRLLPALAERLHAETTRCDHCRLSVGIRKHAIENALNPKSPPEA
jgi:hypothetical protein